MKIWNKSDTKFLIKLLLIIALFSFLFSISYCYQSNREKKLEIYKYSKAIIVQVDKANYSGRGALVKYNVGSKKYTNTILCDCSKLKKGDSIEIKYSIENPNIITLK